MQVFSDITKDAIDIAQHMSKITMAHFRQNNFTIEQKKDMSPVTIVDKKCEEYARNIINDKYPTHNIVGEEYDNKNHHSDFTWIIDPIDGTKSFICGNPLFGCLIAICYELKPVIGVMAIPALDELWHANMMGDKTCYCNNNIMTSYQHMTHLNQAILLTTSPQYIPQSQQSVFSYIAAQCQNVRYGGDCVNYGLVAGGWAHIVLEFSLKAYDVFALSPIIQSAGGMITNHHGEGLLLQDSTDYLYDILATASPNLHDIILDNLIS